MKKYIVTIKEVWNQPYEVKAKNAQEALEKVAEGEGIVNENGFVYNHSLDLDQWEVVED